MSSRKYRDILRQVLAGLMAFTLLSGFCTVAVAFAELSKFLNSDRILILAPHPDDETIAAAGVIQGAVKAGAQVKVVLLTSGENNLMSFMAYDKRFFFGPKRIIRMGTMRKQETVNAMKKLGLAGKDVISLGYPDGGTLTILTRRWGEAKSFRGRFSRAKRVPYSDAMTPGAPYFGESILKDLEQIFLEYKPTKIFVSHPADGNPDHQALYLFMQVTLWGLEGKMNSPEIYPYLVHADKWPLPKGYRPELKLTAPSELADGPLTWHQLDLSLAEVSNKYGALQEYPSQSQYAPNRLVSFVRQNELFSDYSVIRIGQAADSSALTYTKQRDRLVVHLKLKRGLNKWLGASMFLLGYKKGISFSAMPKIEIVLRMNSFHIKDKGERLSKKEVRLIAHGKEWVLSIPLLLLGNPDCILSSAGTKLKDLSSAERAWRILALD